MIYYLICFPLLILLYMSQKLPGLTKYKFQQGSITYQKEISVQSEEIILDISYWKLWMNLQCDLQLSIIISLIIQALTWWFHLFYFIYIYKHNLKRGRGKGDRDQQKNSSTKEAIKLDATPNPF